MSFHSPATDRQLRVGSALTGALARIGAEGRWLEWHSWRDWRSATFQGTRHELCFLFSGSGAVAVAEGFLERIEGEALVVPGQLVGDVQIVQVTQNADPAWLRLRFEVLLLEESPASGSAAIGDRK